MSGNWVDPFRNYVDKERPWGVRHVYDATYSAGKAVGNGVDSTIRNVEKHGGSTGKFLGAGARCARDYVDAKNPVFNDNRKK